MKALTNGVSVYLRMVRAKRKRVLATLAQALRPCAGNWYQRIGKDTSFLIVTQFP